MTSLDSSHGWGNLFPRHRGQTAIWVPWRGNVIFMDLDSLGERAIGHLGIMYFIIILLKYVQTLLRAAEVNRMPLCFSIWGSCPVAALLDLRASPCFPAADLTDWLTDSLGPYVVMFPLWASVPLKKVGGYGEGAKTSLRGPPLNSVRSEVTGFQAAGSIWVAVKSQGRDGSIFVLENLTT